MFWYVFVIKRSIVALYVLRKPSSSYILIVLLRDKSKTKSCTKNVCIRCSYKTAIIGRTFTYLFVFQSRPKYCTDSNSNFGNFAAQPRLSDSSTVSDTWMASWPVLMSYQKVVKVDQDTNSSCTQLSYYRVHRRSFTAEVSIIAKVWRLNTDQKVKMGSWTISWLLIILKNCPLVTNIGYGNKLDRGIPLRTYFFLA